MPKRFSRLKYALKTLNTSTNFANPPATPPTAPAGTVLADFQKAVQTQVFGNITRSAQSMPGSAVRVNIQPFGYNNVTDEITRVSMSGRSAAKMATSLTTANLNHVTTAGRRRRGFQAAKAVLNDLSSAASITSGADPTKSSQITGIKYKYKGSGSYTFPFGAGTGTTQQYESAMQQTIIGYANALGAGRVITFKPERG